MDPVSYLKHTSPIKIAVIGDLCLDLAYRVTTEGGEVSVETGLQTYSVIGTTPSLGGACNVALNCKTLGAEEVDLYGIVGDDLFTGVLIDLFDRFGIGHRGVVQQKIGWATHVYHKVYDGHTEHPRYDSGNFNDPSPESLDTLFSVLEERLDSYDVVIINEQVPKGLHSKAFQQRLNALIASHSSVVWIADCRRLNAVYANTIHKLNENEGRRLIGSSLTGSDLAKALYDHFNKAVIMTLGENGALVADGESVVRLDGLHLTGRIDAVGAGDAFLGGMVVTLARGASLVDAATVGNLAAGVSLRVLYSCGNPTIDEVVALSSTAEYRYNPDRAADVRGAVYYENTPIEIVDSVEGFDFPALAIFDNDGTISVLRQGWEAVMEKMMIAAIAGDRYGALSIAEIERIRIASLEFINATTGIQTIEQMHQLTEMIASYGYVPADKILTPLEYKGIYNVDLLKMVNNRIDEFKAGRLGVEDLVMKGSVEFLHFLHDRGVKLYLASGTDQADVEREAELLGYAPLFEGRIFGSVGRVDADPKKVVIADILSSIDVPPTRCAIFGDGPVEMREGRRQGLLSVGLLSDEVRRYGTNGAKRSRLVLGGATVLIPDFSYRSELIRLLGWEEGSHV
jgi:sugar/nucleoside kinase (ribokinase family)/phosphoglycolate phosphatase-like HAD superfamily hydrolase